MKKVLISLSALFLILLLSFKAVDTDPVVSRIIEIAATDNQTMQHLDILANRFGGRITGSDACENAERWAAQKFREWGMEVIMDEIDEVPVGFTRGPWSGRLLSDNGMILHFATPSYTSGTKGVQRGHVVMEPKTRQEFDRIKTKLKGAWVLITGENEGFPVDWSEQGDIIRDSVIALNVEINKKNREIDAENKKNEGRKKAKELLPLADEPALFYRQMKEAGILGIIQSSKVPIRVQYDRKNLFNISFDKLPDLPDIRLNEHQYKIIEQMVKERQTFELEFHIRNHFRMGPVKFHNVIGVIPGTEFPDEYVIMGGHLDSYDVATGASDNASGAVIAMEAARLIMEAGGKPKRTILVCLWGAEEFGLLGSWSWVNRNADKLDKISNMFNWDSGPRAFTGVSVSDAMMKDMIPICDVLKTLNPEIPFTITLRDPRPRPERAWGTDSGPFAVKGVPTFTFNGGDPKGYDFHYHEIWHTERDEFSKIIPEYMNHNAIVQAVVVYGVANLDHLLPKEGYYLGN